MKIVEFDVVFLSYDEPNAEENYADLANKAPWAKRVHGVKGSDAAHKAAAEQSETDWFITIDADNIVESSFFNLDLDMSDPKIQVYGWCGKNNINGLRYGNGGPKIWKKDFVLGMKTHEAAQDDRAQVDFCWEDGYKNHPVTYSDSIINKTPFQAWRAGFREGVKMTLLDGVKVTPQDLEKKIWWHNIHRLRMWSTVGSHIQNGIYAVLGARQGTHMTNCTDWNHVDVRDFEILRDLYKEIVPETEEAVTEEIQRLGKEIKLQLGLEWPWLDAKQSKYTADLYDEALRLGTTYYNLKHV